MTVAAATPAIRALEPKCRSPLHACLAFMEFAFCYSPAPRRTLGLALQP
jgi:hypothetical protein